MYNQGKGRWSINKYIYYTCMYIFIKKVVYTWGKFETCLTFLNKEKN